MTEQLGFEALLDEADTYNRNRRFEQRTAHLPGIMDDALLFYRALIDRHHAAMMAADVDETMRLRKEAHMLAKKLNGGDPGILAHDDAPGYVLEQENAAPPGEIPVWGQTGVFDVTLSNTRIRIEIESVFGIAFGIRYWPGFAARAVDPAKPFISATGYRSFLGVHMEERAGVTPDVYTIEVLEAYVEHELNGQLVEICERYHASIS
ncbi:MAG: hypothetical protein AAGB10_22730 [Pseudomonadota bacterium]